MYTIREGMLFETKPAYDKVNGKYFTNSQHSATGSIGTTVVAIIRRPMWYDRSHTVTVVPLYPFAIGEDEHDPVITIECLDSYGYKCKKYQFAPHMLTSIPIARLGQFIGILSDTEYLLLQTEVTRALTNFDEEVTPVSIYYKASHTEIPEAPDAPVKKKYSNTKSPTIYDVNPMVAHDKSYHKTKYVSSRASKNDCKVYIDDAMSANVGVDKHHLENTMNPADCGFPKSTFDIEDLNEYANGFRIPAGFYDGTIKFRSSKYLTNEEINRIRENTPKYVFATIMDRYETMTVADTAFFGKYMLSSSLAKILNIDIKEVHAFKALCTYIYRFTDEEWDKRVQNFEKADQDDVPFVMNEDKHTETFDKKQAKAIVKKLSPYLNQSMNIPESMASDFLRLPAYIVKSHYQGKNFPAAYRMATERCKKIVESKE